MRTSAAATASGIGIRLGWQLIAFGMQLTVDAPLVGRRYSFPGNAIREDTIPFHPGAVFLSRMDWSFPYGHIAACAARGDQSGVAPFSRYFLCGVIWLYQGGVRQMFYEAREQLALIRTRK